MTSVPELNTFKTDGPAAGHRFAQPRHILTKGEHWWVLAGEDGERLAGILARVADEQDRSALSLILGCDLGPDIRRYVDQGVTELRAPLGDGLAQDIADEERRLEVRERAQANRRAAREEFLRSTEGLDAAADEFAEDVTDCPEDDWAPREPLVDGLLYRRTVNRIVGPSGSLKSFAVIDIANHVQLGRSWHGREVTRVNGLYVAAEGQAGVPGRKLAWELHHNDGRPTGLRYRRTPVQLSDPEQVRRLIAWCRREEIGLIALDTQAKSTVGVDENDNSAMTEVMRTADTIADETGACVLLVHHPAGDLTGASGRGAKGVFGALDGEIHAERKGKDSGEDRIVLTTPKLKDDATSTEIVMRVQRVEINRPGQRYSLALIDELTVPAGKFGQPAGTVERPKGYADAHLAYLNVIAEWDPSGGITATELGRKVGKGKSTVSTTTNTMAGAGLIRKTPSNRWEITEDGRKAIRWAARQPAPEPSQESIPGTEPDRTTTELGPNQS